MMQKQLKTNSEDNNNEKALNRLASFFIIQNENVRFAQESLSVLGKNNPKGVNMLRNSTCFKLKIAHENLHRNRTKNKAPNPSTVQQLRRVVSKCSVWW
jgi:hypothetical protein